VLNVPDPPDNVIPLTVDGVIAPRLKLNVGVVVEFVTVPVIPLALVNANCVTVPPVPVADNVPPEKLTPVPMVTFENPPAPLPYNNDEPLVAGA